MTHVTGANCGIKHGKSERFFLLRLMYYKNEIISINYVYQLIDERLENKKLLINDE